jgi:hypothetical protein
MALSPSCPDRLWGPPNLLRKGVPGALSLGVNRPGCEAEYPPPSSAEVKNAWRYISTPQYTFMVWYSVTSIGATLRYLHMALIMYKSRSATESNFKSGPTYVAT